jgi:uncharacterized RDD family membrane protein YckC
MNEEKPSPRSIPPPVLPTPSLSGFTPPPVIRSSISAPGSPGQGVKLKVRILPTRSAGDAPDESSDSPYKGPADFNARFLAAVIDLTVSAGLAATLVWLLPGWPESLAWLIAIAYFLTRDNLGFLGGRSVGKKAMRLQVLAAGQRSLSGNWRAGLIRNAALLVPPIPLVEVYLLLTREELPGVTRRLGDEWAKTSVMALRDPPEEDER